MKNITVYVEEQDFKLTAFYHLYKSAVEDFGENDTDFLDARNSSLFHLSHDSEVLLRSVAAFASTIVSCMGIVGNIFSVLVLSKRKMRSPIACFLLGLAVADMFFVLFGSFLWNIPSVIAFFDPTDGKIQSSYSMATALSTPVLFAVAMTAQTASIFFTMAVTMERYIAVCHPFKARTTLTWTRAWLISLGVTVFSILYNAPRWWEYDVAPIYDTATHEIRGYIPIGTEITKNFHYNVIYRFGAYLMLLNILPIVTLSVLNILIYKKVRTANEQRQSLSSSQRHENSLAFMLIVVVSVFIFCNILPLIESFVIIAMGLQESVVELESLRNFLIMLNSSINFVIYCFYGEKFRELFLEMLPGWMKCMCCCCPKPDEKLNYWAGSYSDASASRKSRLSQFTASIKTLKDLDLQEMFVSHI